MTTSPVVDSSRPSKAALLEMRAITKRFPGVLALSDVSFTQELHQVTQLSITENIFLGSEITRGPLIDWAEMHQQARQLLTKLRLDVDPRTNLPGSETQSQKELLS